MVAEANAAKIERLAAHWLIGFIAFASSFPDFWTQSIVCDARLSLSEAYSFSTSSCTLTVFGVHGCLQTLAMRIPAAPAADREFLKEDFFSISPVAKAP